MTRFTSAQQRRNRIIRAIAKRYPWPDDLASLARQISEDTGHRVGEDELVGLLVAAGEAAGRKAIARATGTTKARRRGRGAKR